MGISADALPKIFQPFEQGDTAVTKHFGGLGLGLAISKALVELHGGTISAASPGRGRGATFTVRLPLAAVGTVVAGGALGPALARERLARKPLSILLVEDHAPTLQVLTRILTAQGHTVTAADSVARARELLAGAAYDLAISDIGLPDGSGLDLLPEFTARNVRAIAVSGFGMEHDVQRSAAAGFVAHLTKPINVEQLQTAIAGVDD